MSKVSVVLRTPVLSNAPKLGLKPITPQKLAGLIIEPAVWVASEIGKAPQATATADPAEEVPVI